MQKDMHFYGVYVLARSAGIKPETANIIAYSSQFVDDAIDDQAIILPNQQVVLPTMTSHRPLDYQNTLSGDQWKVWVPFHFLPGNEPSDGNYLKKMVCGKNSETAQEMVRHGLLSKTEPWGPHLIGITAHVYADTFAHYGFSGIAGKWNKVDNDTVEPRPKSNSILNYLKTKFEQLKAHVAGTLAETIPVGHGAVATYPDRPYLNWEYEYEDKIWKENEKKRKRKNSEDFIEACYQLFNMFCEFLKSNSDHGDSSEASKWEDIEGKVKEIIETEGSKEERSELWIKAAVESVFFQTHDKDKDLGYNEKLWSPASIVRYFSDHGNVDDCDVCYFYKAAWYHRHYILRELLPKIGLLAE